MVMFSAVLTAVNLTSVKDSGEFGFGFALLFGWLPACSRRGWRGLNLPAGVDVRAPGPALDAPPRRPPRGWSFAWLTVVGLVILAAIFTVGFIGEDSRPQLLSTFALVALLAVANGLHYRSGKVAPVEASEGNQAVCAPRLTETRRTNGNGWNDSLALLGKLAPKERLL